MIVNRFIYCFWFLFMFMHFHALSATVGAFPGIERCKSLLFFFAYIYFFTRRRTIDPNYCCRKLNWAGESEREREFILFEIYRPTQELKCDAINSFLNSNYWHQILARISSRQCRDSERERERVKDPKNAWDLSHRISEPTTSHGQRNLIIIRNKKKKPLCAVYKLSRALPIFDSQISTLESV